ncbi:hypothetical protein SLA2020_103240 [Shorea laevis]
MRAPAGRGGGRGVRGGRGDGGRGRGRGSGSAMKSRGGGRSGGRGGEEAAVEVKEKWNVGARLLLSHTDTRECLLLRERRMLLLLRIWSPVRLSTMRRGSLCRMKMEAKWSTGYGILSVQSWRLQFLLVLTIYGLNLVLKFYTLELLLGPVSHVSDVVGPTGVVYAVEFSHRSGRDLVNMAKKRTNVIPTNEDARHPAKYRMLVGMVDVIFSDVAQPDQARILALNASYFLKSGGHFVISIKANCIDSTVPAEHVFRSEVNKLRQEQFKPFEQVTIEPFERDHACVVGGY